MFLPSYELIKRDNSVARGYTFDIIIWKVGESRNLKHRICMENVLSFVSLLELFYQSLRLMAAIIISKKIIHSDRLSARTVVSTRIL